MRTQFHIVVFVLLLSACAGDELHQICADPVGSDTYSVKHNGWICFLPNINGCYRVELGSQPLFRAIAVSGHVQGTIADAGPVECLGGISIKPAGGEFSSVVPATLHHGYVVSFPDGTYGRFYLDSWSQGSSGEVTEINVTRQYAF